jgi:plasmid stabilization system protein ParE
MKYNVIVELSFDEDLEKIFNFYEYKNILYANRLIIKVNLIINSLVDFPEKFAKIPEISTFGDLNIRQCVCDNFRIIYQIKNSNIHILAMLGKNLLDITKTY